MTFLQVVFELEEALRKIDACTETCFGADVDYTFLSLAKDALISQIAGIKQTLVYKMEQYDAYGEPLDEIGVDGLRAAIDEVGYDEIRALFGDSIDAVLSEAATEKEIYRV